MLNQRPSSHHSQDVSHILKNEFRQLFASNPTLSQEQIDSLRSTSLKNGDLFQNRLASSLSAIYEEWNQRIHDANSLEKHIIHARTKAEAADAHLFAKTKGDCVGYDSLNLPATRSYFRSCIDNEYLNNNKLLSPAKYSTEAPPPVPLPKGPSQPTYLEDTANFEYKTAHISSGSSYNQSKRPPSAISDDDPFAEENLPKIPSVNESPRWKQEPPHLQRVQDRADLDLLEQKVDHLRNPRHLAPSQTRDVIRKKKKKQKLSIPTNLSGASADRFLAPPTEHTVVFAAEPESVVFTDYVPGKIYQMSLDIRNVSSVSRSYRMIPPACEYFSVTTGDFPGGEKGFIAPGMSSRHMVRFAPDSLADFDDEMTVISQASQPLKISIHGKRPQPELDLPKVLDLDHCLVGDSKTVVFTVRNLGGAGSFLVAPAGTQPNKDFQKLIYDAPECAEFGWFKVSPTVLSLEPSGTAKLEVTFTPTKGICSRDFSLVCDNCRTFDYRLTGEGKQVELEFIAIEEGEWYPEPGQSVDYSADHRIKFCDLNPFTYTVRTLSLINRLNLELSYRWTIVLPNMAVAGCDCGSQVQERIVDVGTVFSVDPAEGCLPASKSYDFNIAFAPPKVYDFYSVAHLIIDNVPIESVPPEFVDKVLRPKDDGEKLVSFTIMEVELRGSCIPLNVSMEPSVILFAGKVIALTPQKRYFKLMNKSLTSVQYQWAPITDSEGEYVIEIQPALGEIESQSEQSLQVTVTGSKPLKISRRIECYVQNMSNSLFLSVEAEISGPEVEINCADLNFGLVKLGTEVSCLLSVSNTSPIQAHWSISESSGLPAEMESKPTKQFIFGPESGVIQPLGEAKIGITFRPSCVQSLRTVFEISVKDGKNRYLAVAANVITPEACLSKCIFKLEKEFVGVESTHEFLMHNVTELPAEFMWSTPYDGDNCRIRIEPSNGVLEPKSAANSSKIMKLHFTPHRVGTMDRVLLPCHVAECPEPLILSVEASTSGLSIFYTVTEDPYDYIRTEEDVTKPACSPDVDFGPAVPLGKSRTRYIHISNRSGIETPFNCFMDKFAAAPLPVQITDNLNNSNKAKRPIMLQAKERPFLKNIKTDIGQNSLKTGLGAAFLPTPSSGVLKPFSTKTIELTAYSDMWGQYSDFFVCCVGDEAPVKLSVLLKVDGIAVKFLMTGGRPELSPIMRFGTQLSNGLLVTRPSRVYNTSPFDIRVDWKIFVLKQHDPQLVDLLTIFADPFPLLDKNGNAIENSEPDHGTPLPPVPRAITPHADILPETSPDSSIHSPIDPNKQPASLGQLCNAVALDNSNNNNEREDLIRIMIKPHLGYVTEDVFAISPKQMVIPARGSIPIDLQFNPGSPNIPSCDGVVDIAGYALGYVSLDDPNTRISNHVTRLDGYDVEPLRIDMMAYVQNAQLSIDYGDNEDCVRFRAAISELYDADSTKWHDFCQETSITVNNRTEMQLRFNIEASAPFSVGHITGQKKSSPPCGLRDKSKPLSMCIYPGRNAQLTINATITKSIVDKVSELMVKEASETTEKESTGSMHLATICQERRLCIQEQLRFSFENDSKQVVPMELCIILPSLVVTPGFINFGTCFIGEIATQYLDISNPTGSTSFWKAELTPFKEEIAVHPSSGCLQAQIRYIDNNKISIAVHYQPKSTDKIETSLRITGIFAEEPVNISIAGEGTRDEKYEFRGYKPPFSGDPTGNNIS